MRSAPCVRDCVRTQKSHQRQLVDCSGPTYKERLLNLGIPPTAVGGLFRSNLQGTAFEFRNPTNGSWWIVQVQPVRLAEGTETENRSIWPARFGSEAGSEPSTNSRWWDSETLVTAVFRRDLKNPPTPVGGISECSRNIYRGGGCDPL
jgi:hypothetical protein